MQTALEEGLARLSAAIKGEAVGRRGGAALLPVERVILDFRALEAQDCRVAPCLLAPIVKARELAFELLRTSGATSFTEHTDVLQRNSDTLLKADPTWVWEDLFPRTGFKQAITRRCEETY